MNRSDGSDSNMDQGLSWSGKEAGDCRDHFGSNGRQLRVILFGIAKGSVAMEA